MSHDLTASSVASPGRQAALPQLAAATSESRLARLTLTITALAFVALFLLLPLAAVFTEALRKGRPSSWPHLATPRPSRRSA